MEVNSILCELSNEWDCSAFELYNCIYSLQSCRFDLCENARFFLNIRSIFTIFLNWNIVNSSNNNKFSNKKED